MANAPECTYMFYDKENFEGNSFVFETAGNYGGHKPMSKVSYWVVPSL